MIGQLEIDYLRCLRSDGMSDDEEQIDPEHWVVFVRWRPVWRNQPLDEWLQGFDLAYQQFIACPIGQ